MCEVMGGAGQVTPVEGLSDIDCRLTGVDRVTLPVAEIGPEGEKFRVSIWNPVRRRMHTQRAVWRLRSAISTSCNTLLY